LRGAGASDEIFAVVSVSVTIRHLYVCPPRLAVPEPAGCGAMMEVAAVNCRAGYGIEGDRFFGYSPDLKGHVTFFSWQVFQSARRQFGMPSLEPSAFRRNVVIEGVDLTSLVGTEFAVGGIEFLGTEVAPPEYWMNNAIAPGAEGWIRRNGGGLRVRVLSDGELRVGPHTVTVLAEQMAMAGRG
jgi:hypothetical protein